MKTIKNIYPQVYAFSNLLLAARKAQKGKRKQQNVASFNFILEKKLLELKEQLENKSYSPGSYKTFTIYEPKQRMISAAPYIDRVVHHALCNIIEPVFEKTFIYDSYANRKGKGTHKALDRYKKFAQLNRYVLKMDIKNYFPSIDHEILKQTIRRKIGCRDTLWLIDKIIDNSNPQKPSIVNFPGDDLFTAVERRKGLPIGNLTSQFFANIYLNPLDHFVKEKLRCKYYVRYVDDFVVFSNSKKYLHAVRKKIIDFLTGLRLQLHKNKSKVFPVKTGITFLGHKMFPYYSLLKSDNVKRFRKKLKVKAGLLKQEKIYIEEFHASIQSWGAHARYSRTYRLRKSINEELLKQGINLKQKVFCAAGPGTTTQTTAALPTATGTTPTTRTTTTASVSSSNTINSRSFLF
jgi:retron-type reverse transcriptase